MKDIHADTIIAIVVFAVGAALGLLAARIVARERTAHVDATVERDHKDGQRTAGIRIGIGVGSIEHTDGLSMVDTNGVRSWEALGSVRNRGGIEGTLSIDAHDGRLAIDGYCLSVDCSRVAACQALHAAVAASCECEGNCQCQN